MRSQWLYIPLFHFPFSLILFLSQQLMMTAQSWPARFDFPAGCGSEYVAIKNFDSDGHQDLAVANFLSDNIAIMKGNGDGSFAPASLDSGGRRCILKVR